MLTVNFGALDRIGTRFSLFLENCFRSLGKNVGSRPWAWILGALIFCAICCIGLLNFEREFRGEKLWNPTGTEAAEDKEYIEDHYKRPYRFSEVMLFNDVEGKDGDALIPDVFNILFNFQLKVVSLTAENPDAEADGKPLLVYDNSTVANSDKMVRVCHVRGDSCFVRSFPDAMGNNPANWDTHEKILEFVNLDSINSSSGFPFHPSTLLGGVKRDENGTIISAKAVASQFPLQNNEEYDGNSDPDDPKAEKWEDVYLDESEKFEKETTNYTVYRAASRSFEDEFRRTINGDLQLLNVAIILLLVYSIAMMSRWSEGCVGFRFLLSIGGFISIGLALVAALGLGSGFGIFYSPLMDIYPFLLIGIGVDDVFVFINAMDATSKSLTIADRLSNALAVSGTSITVTSITDFFAFLIGSNTSLPALRNFSLYAAIGILFTLFMQVTFFAGIVTYDEKRHDEDGCGVFPCFTIQKKPLLCCQRSKDTFMARCFESLGKFLTNPWVKGVVIISFVGLGAAGIAGTAQMEVDADIDDFFPTGSYLTDWLDATSEYFTNSGSPTAIYMKEVNFTDSQIHEQMTSMVEAFRDDRYVENYTVKSWFEEFSNYLGEAPPTGDEFIVSLKEWLQDEGSGFRQDVIFDDREDSIVTSRMTGNHVFFDYSDGWVKSMNSIRETVKNQPDPLGSSSFAYGRDYVEIEQYKAIEREAFTNISLALLMVLVIVTLLLVNPIAAGLTFISIALVVIDLVGYMYWWGNRIDNVLVIFVVISLGLSVDYAVHISHMFLKTPGKPDERLIVALRDMGPAVFNGAMSTFIAVLVLSLTDSYIFVVFFRSLFLCVVLGLGHGIIFLPVCLSIFAPAPHAKEVEPNKDIQMQETPTNGDIPPAKETE